MAVQYATIPRHSKIGKNENGKTNQRDINGLGNFSNVRFVSERFTLVRGIRPRFSYTYFEKTLSKIHESYSRIFQIIKSALGRSNTRYRRLCQLRKTTLPKGLIRGPFFCLRFVMFLSLGRLLGEYIPGPKMANVINLEKYRHAINERILVEKLKLLNWDGIHNLLDVIKDDLPLTARIIFLMGKYEIDPSRWD